MFLIAFFKVAAYGISIFKVPAVCRAVLNQYKKIDYAYACFYFSHVQYR
jgi:hypothetical protein